MVAVTAAVLLTMVVPAGAKPKPPVNGVGTVHCMVSAKISYNPPLKASGGPMMETVTLKSKLLSCTGTVDGAHVSNGKSVVVTIDNTNDCTKVLTGAGGGTAPPGTIAWKGSEKLNPSTGVTLGTSTTNTGPPITLNSSGGVVAGGSFATDGVSTHSVLVESLALITSKCGSKGGLKSLHINPSQSTFTMSH
jgi:hypothetical protein